MKTWQDEEYKLKHEIIPGILEKKWEDIEKKIESVESFAQTIHIDLIDGKFANNQTCMDPKPFAKYTKDILFELHMIVDNPLQYLKPFADAGFRRFIGHIEKMPDITEFVAEGQILGEIGLAIDGPTSLDKINIQLDDLDCLLIYTSNQAGFSGPAFVPSRLEKVKKIRENSNIPIEIDGGVTDKTIMQAKAAGVNRFVTTSFLFGSNNPFDRYQMLTKLIQES